MSKILIVENLWWPFASHIIHILWSKIYADHNNMKYFYNKNSRVQGLFKNNNIESYFESFSDKINKNDIVIKYKEPKYNYYPNWFSTNFENADEYKGYLLQQIVRPNNYIKKKLDNISFYQEIKKLNGNYIGLHIRWTDKINGPAKETEYISPEKYMTCCNKIRETYNINTIVLCTDTIDVIPIIEKLNDTYKFHLMYDKDETRAPNDWKESIVYKVNHFRETITEKELAKEYITAFKIYLILFNSFSIVGNYDSNMCMIPVMARRYPRNNNKDLSVTDREGRWNK